MDKTQQKIILTVCISVILIAILLCIMLEKDDSPRNPVNNGLASLTEFDVDCPETGTSAEGTFFVVQGKDSMKVEIVADLTVDETDKEGVEFFIPAELNIVSVLCSFNDDISAKYAVVRDWPEGGHFVYIAKSRYSPAGTQIGGDGTVIIELHLNEKFKLDNIDSLDFQVTAANTITKDITIPISH